MFARIYPILRLPRRFGVFDYRIPDDITVRVGDLVRIPFHGRTASGVVASMSETTERMGNVSDLVDVAWKAACTPADVTRIEQLAASIAQSPSTVWYSLFGSFGDDVAAPTCTTSPHTISLARTVAATVREAIDRASPDAPLVIQTSQEGGLAMAQLLRKKYRGQLLILAPRERDADLAARLVPLGPRTAVLHGATKPRQRERIIRAWRGGMVDTLIGTRQASLLPACTLNAVLVLTSGTNDHFNDRKNPRFDTRNAGYLQAAQHHAAFVATDVLPRPEDHMLGTVVYAHPPSTIHHPTMIDLRDRLAQSEYPLLTLPLFEAMKTALQSGKKVLLFYNRKGVAKRAQCRTCGYVVVCACGLVYGVDDQGLHCSRCDTRQAVPEACPNCTDGVVGLRGIGNVHLEQSLATLFPGVTIGRIEKGHIDNAQILLVTEFFFSSMVTPFSRKEFGLVTDIAADLSLHPDNFRSGEDTARKLHRLAAFAQQQGAACMVQTWLPDEIGAMTDARSFLEKESAIRERYGLPPHRAVITVRHVDAEALTTLTGQFFANVDDDTVVTRIPTSQLSSLLPPLSSLPDTAVISVDQPYGTTLRPPRTES